VDRRREMEEYRWSDIAVMENEKDRAGKGI